MGREGEPGQGRCLLSGQVVRPAWSQDQAVGGSGSGQMPGPAT